MESPEFSRGWSITEILTLLAIAGLTLLGVASLVEQRGLGGTLKLLGIGALVLLPLVGGIVFLAERRHRALARQTRDADGE